MGFGERRKVPAGEDVFRNPGISDNFRDISPDGMQKKDPSWFEDVMNNPHEFLIMRGINMLKHPHTNDRIVNPFGLIEEITIVI
jgi:hypothetical protein